MQGLYWRYCCEMFSLLRRSILVLKSVLHDVLVLKDVLGCSSFFRQPTKDFPNEREKQFFAFPGQLCFARLEGLVRDWR